MSQLALVVASHITRELQITPWNLSSNFVACTNQDAKEHLAALPDTSCQGNHGKHQLMLLTKITMKRLKMQLIMRILMSNMRVQRHKLLLRRIYVLPKKKYFSAEASRFTLVHRLFLMMKTMTKMRKLKQNPLVEDTRVEVHTITSSGDQDKHHDVYSERGIHTEDDQQLDSLDT